MANPYGFLSELRIDAFASASVSRNLHNVEIGVTDNHRTPFMGDVPSDQILKEFDSSMDIESSTQLDGKLVELELSQRSKFGPRSIAKPWSERKMAIQQNFTSVNPNYEHRGLEWEIGQNLRPVSLKAALNKLKNQTSSGLPFMRKKGVVKDRIDQVMLRSLLERKDPCVLFTRTQEGGKTRTVWGYPIAETILEMMYYIPLLESQRKQPWRAAIIGPEQVDFKIAQLFPIRESGFKMVSVDFSAYDEHLRPVPHQMMAFNSIKNLFQSSELILDDLARIQERFANIGLITPDGVKGGEHGVPSGSVFTNEVDSLVQFLIARTMSDVGGTNCQIQGDDGAYVTRHPEKLIQVFQDFGLEVNKDKTHISEDYIVYLQNYYSRSYYDDRGHMRGIYPIYRALNRIIHQERWSNFEEHKVSGVDYYSLRAIAILENCRYHPLFNKLVKFVAEHDKYNLKYSQKGKSKIIEMTRRTSDLVNPMVHQYGDDLTGLGKFATVKYLRELGF